MFLDGFSKKFSFIWLNKAMVVNVCFNTTDSNVGLALSADNSKQKCYMADTGLLVTHTFIYTFLAPIFTARGLSLDNQMRKLNCFVESVEEKIAQIANEEHYYKLISELDELTEVGLKYLSEHSLTIGLSEKLAAELRAGGNESNYVIANALREGRMVWEDDISVKTYFDIYCNVDEMYGIMSSH